MDAAVSTASPAGVSLASVAAAMARARESARADALFRDPLAQVLIDAATAGMGAADLLRLRDWVDQFYSRGVVRTRFIDDHLREVTAGPCRQVVLLGAGLDTRAFRLPWPGGTCLFEVDVPRVLRFKERALAGAAAGCRRVLVEAGPPAGWADRPMVSPFDPARPTAWVTEGALHYLADDEARRLLTWIGAHSAAGSRLVLEHTAARPSVVFRGGLGPDGPDWLAGQGWTISSHRRPAVGLRLGRPDSRLPGAQFITAIRD
ncbi:SAM-dependent methyltransferase [Actinoplanes sp. NPDC026619]|uniref:class I SAM-dependent methyltransferase n=1 Tax=Actinoplanes sp. NPDC026619 TaxID=3155798 RepID=UPI0033D807B1